TSVPEKERDPGRERSVPAGDGIRSGRPPFGCHCPGRRSARERNATAGDVTESDKRKSCPAGSANRAGEGKNGTVDESLPAPGRGPERKAPEPAPGRGV